MFLSVIIPVYNAEKYLPQALESVLAQTYTDYECVCVNDGSTDGSAEILAQYEGRFSRAGRVLRIVTKPNGGEGSARNAGIDAAQGDYITWLDADDVLAPTRFEVAARIIEKEHPDLVRLYYQMGEQMPESFAVQPDFAYETLTEPRQIFLWGWDELNGNGMVWLWFAKRELLASLRFRPEMRVKTDCVFSSSLIPRIKKLCISKDDGLFYRLLPTSMFHSARRAQDCVNCQTAFLGLWNEQKEYAESIGGLDCLKERIRWCAQSDLLDWVRMCHRDESADDRAAVRKAYLAIRRSGAFCEHFVLKARYRLALPLYDVFGWLWPMHCVENLLTCYRKMAKKLRCLRCEEK